MTHRQPRKSPDKRFDYTDKNLNCFSIFKINYVYLEELRALGLTINISPIVELTTTICTTISELKQLFFPQLFVLVYSNTVYKRNKCCFSTSTCLVSETVDKSYQLYKQFGKNNFGRDYIQGGWDREGGGGGELGSKRGRGEKVGQKRMERRDRETERV